MEIHIARESTKHGFAPDEARAFFARRGWEQFPHTHICGLMTMGTATDDRTQTRAELHQVRRLFDELRQQCALPYFTELSMGMSDDFDMVALETVNNQYLGGDASLACSAETQTKIDQRVVELVKAQHEKAVNILTENRAKLDELAQYLYEKETITGEEFMHILNEA